MARYRVQVLVAFDYEVEADSREEAEEQGWAWEDYTFSSMIDEITVKELDEDEE